MFCVYGWSNFGFGLMIGGEASPVGAQGGGLRGHGVVSRIAPLALMRVRGGALFDSVERTPA